MNNRKKEASIVNIFFFILIGVVGLLIIFMMGGSAINTVAGAVGLNVNAGFWPLLFLLMFILPVVFIVAGMQNIFRGFF